jgi:hypothetical protein
LSDGSTTLGLAALFSFNASVSTLRGGLEPLAENWDIIFSSSAIPLSAGCGLSAALPEDESAGVASESLPKGLFKLLCPSLVEWLLVWVFG